jgi:hypothetical protein
MGKKAPEFVRGISCHPSNHTTRISQKHQIMYYWVYEIACLSWERAYRVVNINNVIVLSG